MVLLFGFGFGGLDIPAFDLPAPPITIGGIEIKGVVEVTDRGGMNAPEKRTEQGFSWSSYVDSKPLELDVRAWVPAEDYDRLTSLRDETEPVRASVDQAAVEQAVVEDLEVVNTSEKKSHYEVTFALREVRQSSTDTTTLTVSTGNGQASGSPTAERPSFVQSSEDTSGAGEQVEENSGGGGNFVSDAIGGAADAIGGLL